MTSRDIYCSGNTVTHFVDIIFRYKGSLLCILRASFDGLICIRFVGDGLKISNFPLYYKNLNFVVTSTLSEVGARKLKRRRYLIIIMLKGSY